MRGEEVVAFLDLLAAEGLVAWLDGGWAVDALVGRQTREHADLDLVVDAAALDRVVALLGADGFAVLRDELPAAVAYRNAPYAARSTSTRSRRRPAAAGGDQAQPGRAPWHYGPPVPGLVAGRPVPCCSLETQLRAHVGYPPRDRGPGRHGHARAALRVRAAGAVRRTRPVGVGETTAGDPGG